MRPNELVGLAGEALMLSGIHATVTLMMPRVPAGFPPGELLCVSREGSAYSFGAAALIAWCWRHRAQLECPAAPQETE